MPLTSGAGKLYASEAYVMVGRIPSKAVADQTTTAGKARLLNRIGVVSDVEMEAVDRAIRVQLGLPETASKKLLAQPTSRETATPPDYCPT